MQEPIVLAENIRTNLRDEENPLGPRLGLLGPPPGRSPAPRRLAIGRATRPCPLRRGRGWRLGRGFFSDGSQGLWGERPRTNQPDKGNFRVAGGLGFSADLFWLTSGLVAFFETVLPPSQPQTRGFRAVA